MRHHTVSIAFILGCTAIFAILSILGMMDLDPVRSELTGMAIAQKQVGYVAVTNQEALKSSMQSIQRFPVYVSAGQFRGHYYIKIEGNPNTIRAAVYQAAMHAAEQDALVYSGIQVEA